MNLYKSIIGVAVAIVVIMGTLVPYISAATFYDTDNSTITFEEYSSGSVDGWTLTATVDGSQLKVTSKFWTGTANDSTYILISDVGSVWYDGTIHSMMGSIYASYSTLDLSISDGKLTVGSTQYSVTSVYLPTKNGNFGSHYDGSVNDPVASVGSFAGITMGTNGGMVFGDSKGYVFGQSSIVGEDRKTIEIHAGVVDIPDVDPFSPDIEHEDDPEPVPVEPGELITSGTVDNITWELDGTVLKITGTGAMPSFSTGAPWPLSAIESVIIGEGITTVGQSSFSGASKLKEVTLPSTIIEIRPQAFRGCTSLANIDLPSTVTKIRTQAFYASGLTALVCPEGLTTLEANAIASCSKLTHLYLPSEVTASAQTGFHFIRLDGYDMGAVPTGDLYLGSKQYVMYQTETVTIDGSVYHINYIGAELEQSQNTETVHIPYTVEYNGTDYTIESIAHGAISGSAVRYVILPQTIESISATAITAPNIQQVLNLSETDAVSEHGQVRTSLPSDITLSKNLGEYNPYTDYLTMIPVIIILSLIVSAVGFMWNRRL